MQLGSDWLDRTAVGTRVPRRPALSCPVAPSHAARTHTVHATTAPRATASRTAIQHRTVAARTARAVGRGHTEQLVQLPVAALAGTAGRSLPRTQHLKLVVTLLADVLVNGHAWLSPRRTDCQSVHVSPDGLANPSYAVWQLSFRLLVDTEFPQQRAGRADVEHMQLADPGLRRRRDQTRFGGHERARVIGSKCVPGSCTCLTIQSAGNVDRHLVGRSAR